MAISGSVVQTDTATYGGAAASASMTLPAAPTSGNLLVAVLSARGKDSTDSRATLSGFTLAETNSKQTPVASEFPTVSHVWWKVSDGTETSISIGYVDLTGSYGNSSAAYLEFDSTDLDLAAVDVSAIDVSNEQTTVTTQTVGPATNTVANALAIGVVSNHQANSWDGGGSWSDSFVQQLRIDDTSSRAGTIVSTKVLSATGAQSSAYSTTDAGSQAVGILLIFAAEEAAPVLKSTAYAGTGTAALVVELQAERSLSYSVTGTADLSLTVNHGHATFAIDATGLPSLATQLTTAESLAHTGTGTAALSVGLSSGNSFSYTGTGTAQLQTTLALGELAYTGTGTVALELQAGKVLNHTAVGTPTLLMDVTHSLTYGGVGTPGFAAVTAATVDATATGQGTAQLSSTVGKSLSYSALGSPGLFLDVSKVIGAGGSGNPGVDKCTNKSFAYTSTGTAGFSAQLLVNTGTVVIVRIRGPLAPISGWF